MGNATYKEVVGIPDSTAQARPERGLRGIHPLQCLLAALLPPFGAALRFALVGQVLRVFRSRPRASQRAFYARSCNRTFGEITFSRRLGE